MYFLLRLNVFVINLVGYFYLFIYLFGLLFVQVIPEGNWFCPCCKCGICGTSDFNSDTKQFTEKTIIYCDQCQRECMLISLSFIFYALKAEMACSDISFFSL